MVKLINVSFLCIKLLEIYISCSAFIMPKDNKELLPKLKERSSSTKINLCCNRIFNFKIIEAP